MVNWFKKETRSLYIARPDDRLNQLIFKHGDKTIPRGAKLTVRASECALFFREGKLIGRIEPGTVQLDTANFPFLGHLIVDPLTGGDHFLTELFFVSTNEIIRRVPGPNVAGHHLMQSSETNRSPIEATESESRPVPLGQYRDLNSGIVVGIEGSISYTIKVVDPEVLVINLAGQSSWAQDKVGEVLDGRLLNQFRHLVGRQTQTRSVLDIVSNVDAEDFSNQVRAIANQEFATLGVAIGRLFDLELLLDNHSLTELKVFGKRESDLAIDAKGAEIATRDGFAQFNYVKGQRAAMQGLGQGLGTGTAPMIFSGGGLGAAFQPPSGAAGHSGVTGRAAPAPRPSGGQVLSSQAAYLILDAGGERGPYTARQVALLAISGGLPLGQMVIRRTDDPPDMTFTADLEPPIAAEIQRRAPPGAAR